MKDLYKKAFLQASHVSDDVFFDSHDGRELADLGARTAISTLYRTLLPNGGDVLDLMCGADSHLPEDISFNQIIGIDVCQKALDCNHSLTEKRKINLNIDTYAHYASIPLDGVFLCNGLPYLTHIEKVFSNVWEVLKPGAPFIITFTQKFFKGKATAIWQALETPDRIRMVRSFLEKSGFSHIDVGDVVPPEDLPAWQDTVQAITARR